MPITESQFGWDALGYRGTGSLPRMQRYAQRWDCLI